ncbi:MAG: cytochrome-c peroxidase [Flavobacteriales bacterium]|nr:cytochrome-c peroxidase [Flavobacteriales bacterium]MBP6696057.1 cytochrome-c peroxidase [Flavobacteriales bacterium]
MGYAPRASLLLMFALLAFASCRRDTVVTPGEDSIGPTPAELMLPAGVVAQIGAPTFPLDNPLTIEGIALGRRLFYEKALSNDLTLSCGSCHVQANAFADPRAFSVGTNGSAGMRNAMSLVNLAWGDRMFWDGRVQGLEAQAHDPVTNPVEMRNSWPVVEDRLNASTTYRALFKSAFGTEIVDSTLVTKALAQFVRTLTSFDSPFDRYWFGGDTTAMSEEARNGLSLFTSQGKCAGCHAPGLFTDNALRNNGMDLTFADPGYGGITGNADDQGKFKVPTLRNIAVTAPYMHDARFDSLEEVFGHYNGGVHMASPNVDLLMDFWGMNPTPFSPDEVHDLIAFMNALTDPTLLTDPVLAEP